MLDFEQKALSIDQTRDAFKLIMLTLDVTASKYFYTCSFLQLSLVLVKLNRQFCATDLTMTLTKTDMAAIPRPLPETRMISTSSRFRLKYCPTISVAGSLVMATPTPGESFKVVEVDKLFKLQNILLGFEPTTFRFSDSS